MIFPYIPFSNLKGDLPEKIDKPRLMVAKAQFACLNLILNGQVKLFEKTKKHELHIIGEEND